MKAKYLFAALSLSALLFSCSKEEMRVSPQGAEDGNLIEIGENFVISGGFGADATKSMWYVDNGLRYMFLPRAAAAAGNNTIAGIAVDAPEVGLCLYTGGAGVLTNYQFIHDGWLESNEPRGARFADCNGPLVNGWRYEDVVAASGILAEPGVTAVTDMAGFFADYAKDGKYTNGVQDGVLSRTHTFSAQSAINAPVAGGNVFPVTAANTLEGTSFDPTAVPADRGNIDLNSGVYKTENKSIFAGEYIVYTPYSDNFVDAGPIKATSELNFANLPTGAWVSATPNDWAAADLALADSDLANNTFSYGFTQIAQGGSQVSNFNLRNLSGMIQMEIETGDDYSAASNITKVALFNENGFVREVQLSAAGIKAGLTSQALYVPGSVVENNVLVAELAPFTPSATEGDKQIFYIPVFPTDLPASGVDVIIYRDDNRVAYIQDVAVGTATTAIESNNAYTCNVVINDDSFVANAYYVVDEATLVAAAGAVAARNANAIITLLGDITITADLGINSNNATRTVTVNGGSIFVPESVGGVTLTIGDGVVFNSDVDLQGVTCCGGMDTAGNLEVNDATVNGDITMIAPEPSQFGFGDAANIVVAPGAYNLAPNVRAPFVGDIAGFGDIDIEADARTVVMDGEINIRGDISVEGDANVDFNGNVSAVNVDLGFDDLLGVASVQFNEDLTCTGNINVFSSTTPLASTALVGCAGTLTIKGAQFNVQEGAIVNLNNVENENGMVVLMAANAVGGGQQIQRTQVNVSGIFNNEAFIEVERATSGNVNDFDAKLNIARTGVFNNLPGAKTQIYGVLAILGDATNSVGATIVDKVSSQVTGNTSKLGGSALYGEYISEVDNPHIRWTVALAERPTSTLRFVGGANSYDMTRVQAIGRDYIKTSGTFEVNTAYGAVTEFYGPHTYDNPLAPVARANAAAMINDLNIVRGDVLVSVGAEGGVNGLLTNLTVNDINVADGNDLTFTNNAASMPVRRAQVAVLVNGELNLNSSPIGAGSDLFVSDGTFVKIADLNIDGAVPSRATFAANTKTIVKNIDNEGVATIVFATAGTDVNGMLWYTETSTGDGEYPNGVPTYDTSVVW